MTHGVRSFAGTRVSEPAPLDSIRDFVYSVGCLELRLQLLRMESREKGVSFDGSCSPVREHRHLFWRLCHNVGGFFAFT